MAGPSADPLRRGEDVPAILRARHGRHGAAGGLGERGDARVPFTVARSCPFWASAPVIRCIYYVYAES